VDNFVDKPILAAGNHRQESDIGIDTGRLFKINTFKISGLKKALRYTAGQLFFACNLCITEVFSAMHCTKMAPA